MCVSIEFPLAQKSSPFGIISDPKIPISIRTLAGYFTYRFLVDTGADFSLAPRRLASQIGLDWNTLQETLVTGIEQGHVPARLGYLPIRIQELDVKVRCLFIDARKSLFILGRADFLDRFVLTIDHSRQRIILTEIKAKT